HIGNGRGLKRVGFELADGSQHVWHDAYKGSQRRGGFDAVTLAAPCFWKDLGNLSEVRQEETRRMLAELFGRLATEGVEGGEHSLELLGERGLRDSPVADSKEFDLTA